MPRPSREQMIRDLSMMPSREQMLKDLQGDRPSALSSAATGAASGMTFGTTPVAAGLGAGAGTLYSNLVEQDLPLGESLGNAWDAFLEGRKERNQFEQAQMAANPKSYIGGNILGGVGTGPLISGAAIAKNAPLMTKIASSAKTGAKAGGLYGAGTAAGSAEDISDAAKRIASGAAIGGGLGALTTGAIEGGKAGYSSIKNLLAKRAAAKGVDTGTLKGILKPETGKEIQQVFKENVSNISPSEKSIAQNLRYKKAGLEPLTPVQQQAKAYSEPTPTQYAETILKSKDPALYEQQLKQIKSYETALDKFRKLGAPTKEAAGQQIKSKLLEGKKQAGKIIGEFKESIADDIVDPSSPGFPQVREELAGIPYADPITGKGTSLGEKMKSLKSIRDVDNLASDIGTAKQQAYVANGYQNSRATHALKEVKDNLEQFIEKQIPEGKPREVYKQYAKAKELFNDTLKGTLKTGGSEKVMNKITATAENFKQFKDVAEKFGKPELIDMARDNYLSNIFNAKNWKLAWEKSAKTEVVKELLPKETISKINLLLKYDAQMRSTMTSTVNPSRSGIVSSLTEMSKKPIKQTVLDLVWGKEKQMKNAIEQYKKAMTRDPKAQEFITDPFRKTRGIVGREIHREYNK